MALDPYSVIVVGCLMFIWIVLGLMFMKEYLPCKIAWIEMITTKGEVLSEVVVSTQGTRSSSFTPGSDVTITLDPPSREADTNGGSQLNPNGATEGVGSSSSGSTDGSHSDMSSFHSLHSNDETQRRSSPDGSPRRDLLKVDQGRMSRPCTLSSKENPNGATEGEGSSSSGSTDGSHSDMSSFHSLHSNDEAQRRSSPDGSPRRDLLKVDQGRMSRPCTLSSTETPSVAALSSEKAGTSSYSDMSQPRTLASTECSS